MVRMTVVAHVLGRPIRFCATPRGIPTGSCVQPHAVWEIALAMRNLANPLALLRRCTRAPQPWRLLESQSVRAPFRDPENVPFRNGAT